MSASLYIISMEGLSRPVKIGVSESPKKRLKQLQTGNARRLVLSHSFLAESREQAMGWEGLAHRLFLDHLVGGEWFDVDIETVINHVDHWMHDPVRKGKPPHRRAGRARLGEESIPFCPVVPAELCGPISQMDYDDRLRLWACFDLPEPPYGFDDWYLVGTPKTGILAAFPVVGFMNGEPKYGPDQVV